jgi:hypothetical protein
MQNLDLLERVRSSPFVDAIRRSNRERADEWRAAGRSLDERLSPIQLTGVPEGIGRPRTSGDGSAGAASVDGCQIRSLRTIARGTVPLRHLTLAKRGRLVLRRWLPMGLQRRIKKLILRVRRVPPPTPPAASARLEARALVRVRSHEEIVATLDPWQRLKGCAFMPEMEGYCGTVQRVLKPVRRFVDERDLQVKEARGVYLLEGAMCEGTETFGPCDRGCLFFWRGEWLEPVDAEIASTSMA